MQSKLYSNMLASNKSFPCLCQQLYFNRLFKKNTDVYFISLKKKTLHPVEAELHITLWL